MPPTASVFVAGVTAIESSVALVTVSVVEPEIVPTAAAIVVVPALSVLALCVVASMLATLGALELNVAFAETSATEPSEKEPVAVNTCVTPTPSVGLVGVTAIETSVALVTVS